MIVSNFKVDLIQLFSKSRPTQSIIVYYNYSVVLKQGSVAANH